MMESDRSLKLTRRVTFSSGHRYWFPDRSLEENTALFGRHASPYYHGHNYVLDATIEGSVRPKTGMVVNIKVLDEVLRTQIVLPFDGRSLNDEVDEFRSLSPTVENLLRVTAVRVQNDLAARRLPDLTHLKLWETPTLYGELHLPQFSINITKTYEFAASHRLHAPSLSLEQNLSLYGKCNHVNGHGHNYLLEVTVAGQVDPVTGMLIDLNTLDEIVNREVLSRYDHRNLDMDVEELRGQVTTSENVAIAIFERLQRAMPLKLERIRLHETARNVFEVSA